MAEAQSIVTETDISQDSTQAAGSATGKAEVIESIKTINEGDGVHIAWFIAGAALFGLLIPQPRFIRWLF